MPIKLNPDAKDRLNAILGSSTQPSEQTTEEATASPLSSVDAFDAIVNDPKYAKDDTFLDKMGRAWDKRTSSAGETISSFMEGDKAPQPDFMTPMGSPAWEEYNRNRAPTLGEASVSLLGDVVGLGFDTMGAGIAETVDNLWGLAPEAMRQDISEEAKASWRAIADSPLGKAFTVAMSKGGEALAAYERDYPNEYKQFAGGLNLVSLGRGNLTTATAKPVSKPAATLPMVRNTALAERELEGIYMASNAPVVYGSRSFVQSAPEEQAAGRPWETFVAQNKPNVVKGRDKDVWDVIVDDSPKAVEEATARGRYADPTMLGKENRILSAAEELQLEAVKKIKGINPLNTMRQNYKLITNRVDELNTAITARLSSFKEAHSWEMINKNFQDALTKAASKDQTTYLKPQALKNYEEMVFKAKELMQQHGTDALGIHNARKDFGRYFRDKASKPETWVEGVDEAVMTSNFRAIYREMNRMVDEIDGGVTGALRAEQHALLEAGKVVAKKAAAQDTTAIGRLLQSMGITSHGKTSVGRARALTYDIPLIVASPILLLLNPIRKGTTMRTGVREAKGKISYGVAAANKDPKGAFKAAAEELRYLLKEVHANKPKAKETLAQLAADTKTVMSVINALEQGTYEPNEAEKQAIELWINQ